ncbi:hypothetical protein BD309DRAFT_991366 [Dichomitus squalens]|nr:hypothetical protein BD309DRAFT_991366 [Dichomitus squalens]
MRHSRPNPIFPSHPSSGIPPPKTASACLVSQGLCAPSHGPEDSAPSLSYGHGQGKFDTRVPPHVPDKRRRRSPNWQGASYPYSRGHTSECHQLSSLSHRPLTR